MDESQETKPFLGMGEKVREGDYSTRSFLVHGYDVTGKWDYNHHVVPPLSSSVTYRLDEATRGCEGFTSFADPQHHSYEKQPIYIYDRLDEPTRSMLEDRLAFVEGGEMAICFATGMAAISSAVLTLLRQGSHFISHNTLYGCTYSLFTNWLPRFGVDGDYLDLTDLSALGRAIRKETRFVYFETPSNPTLQVIDLEGVVGIVRKHNEGRAEEERVRVIVDNTFATPFCQRPLSFGVDMVVHSLTKNIGGFGTDMGGVVVAAKRFESDLLLCRKDFGGSLSPKSAWPVLVYGLPTLDMRLREQQRVAQRVADYLAAHPMVERVYYPGRRDFPGRAIVERQMRDFDGNLAPGNMIYFVLEGTPAEAFDRGRALIDHVARHAYTITLAVSLGQLRTLIEMPASMTHAVVPEEVKTGSGIDAGGIRLSVGVEDAQDIIHDLERALAKLR